MALELPCVVTVTDYFCKTPKLEDVELVERIQDMHINTAPSEIGRMTLEQAFEFVYFLNVQWGN